MLWGKGSFPLPVRGFLNSSNLNTINLKIFPNHSGICTFERKFNKILEREKTPKGLIEIYIFDLDTEGLVVW